MARQAPPKGAATARGPRQLDPLSDERAQDGSQSARAAAGGGQGAPAPQAAGAPMSKPLVLDPLDKKAALTKESASQDASDHAKSGKLESMPAGFNVAPVARAEPMPTDDLEHQLMSTRSKLSSRGFKKSSRLRRMFDAQMSQHEAAVASRPTTAPESEEPRPATAPAPAASAPATPRGQPRSPESAAAVRQRRAREQKELADATSALRKVGPGGWDAPSFAGYRQRFISEGMPGAVKGLTELAAKSSRAALDAGAYRAPGSRNGQVRLPLCSAFRWMDYESLVDDPVLGEGPAPPLVVSAASACEVGLELRRRYPQAQLFVSFEATGFAPGGGALAGADAARPFQQEMLLRTTLEVPVDNAAKHLTEPSTLRGKLTAKTAPSVLAAKDVVIFREGADKGYQFLPQAEQACCTVLVTGRFAERPLMAPNGERFAKEEDAMAYVDRLQTIGLSASALAAAAGFGSGGDVAKGKPFLVIAAQGLTDHADPQPRDSIAKLLQTWRRLYANMFEAVVVACGSVETAAKLDMEINSEVYASAVDGVLTKGSFAWRPKLCALSVNPTMYNLAKQISGGKVAPSAQGKRPSIVYDHHLSSAGQDAEVLEVDDLPELAVEDEGTRSGRRKSSMGRISLIESSMKNLTTTQKRNSSSIWMRDKDHKNRLRDEEDAERNAQHSLLNSDSRSFVARRKHSRLGNSFEKEYENSFKDEATLERERQKGLMAEAANVMSIMTHNIEKGICQNANALALKMPKNVLKEVVKAENRHATQQTPAGLQAEETLRQLQGLAGDIGERLKVRHDEYNTLKKFKEQRQLGGPDSSFKWD